METYTFQTSSGIQLDADYYPALENRKETAVLYFHGGGLMYGMRQDLPALYRQMFTDAGYDFLAFDYPLAPESSLADIHSAAEECVRWFLNDFQSARGGAPSRYLLFGRSAGAYLVLLLANRLRAAGLPAPERLVCFYGYCRFDEPEFNRPSPFYQRYPQIDPDTVRQRVGSAPVTSGPIEKRFSLYVCARQTGNWPLWLAAEESERARYSLTDRELALLPPAFLTASSSDGDVPFRLSKQMARLIPGSLFHPVYYLEHDFDRDTGKKEGREAYQRCLRWLEDGD